MHGEKYEYHFHTLSSTSVPMEMVCPEHGVFKQSPANHMRGKRCAACSGVKKLTTPEFIARSVSVHGDRYDYSEAVYYRNSTEVTIRCKEHGAFKQTPASHMKGAGCPKCGGRERLDIDGFLTRAMKAHGDRYDYSRVVYKNNLTKVEVLCREHGSFLVAPNNLFAGKGCPRCAKSFPLTTDTFVSKAKELHGDTYDYSLVEYMRSNKKVKIVCPEHGVFEQTPNNHLNGSGCRMCANEIIGGKLRLTQDEFISKAADVHGGLYDYTNVVYEKTDVPVVIVCDKHGPFNQTPEKHLAGQGCPSCAFSGPSKGQVELAEFLSNYTTVVSEIREPGLNSRLDIMLPLLGLAVEYHGLIWHSSKVLRNPRKDYEKHVRMRDLGVRVIHIYEDEWMLKKDIVKRSLLASIGILPSVYARDTSLVTLSNEQANVFYSDNHIQGGRKNQVSFGLEYRGVLVAAMSFDMLRSVRKNTDKRHWELTRYASSLRVVGGASKLLKAFTALGLADRLTSYSDSRIFSGGMYEALGFTLTHETPPDYTYTTGDIKYGRKHKSAFQKADLRIMFPHEDFETSTEWEICERNGLYRVYDCGKRRWDLTITQSE